MPIYEFYCDKCNTIYNFFSKSMNTQKIPKCPRCRDVRLKRKMSVFSTRSGRGDSDRPDENIPGIDESKMEKAMGILAREAEKIDADDPRQSAMLMKRLTDATGLKLGPSMEEAMSRMEKGEDPDKIEQEMGHLLEDEEPFIFEKKSRSRSTKPRPSVDDTLYEL